MNFGSVCSGIEAASFALTPLGYHPLWFSETADFPKKVLSYHYPTVRNLGDMNDLTALIDQGEIELPDILCAGTPCQAFSLAGWKNGLIDKRGLLTLALIEIANAIDLKRAEANKPPAIILWENWVGSFIVFGVQIGFKIQRELEKTIEAIKAAQKTNLKSRRTNSLESFGLTNAELVEGLHHS